MTSILQYASLIALCGTAFSFTIGLIKWIDQRNREQQQKEYEAFHRMVCVASGVDEAGKKLRMVQQIAAIYQLQAYRQYAFASVPVLKLLQFEYGKAQDERQNYMDSALSETIKVLSRDKAN